MKASRPKAAAAAPFAVPADAERQGIAARFDWRAPKTGRFVDDAQTQFPVRRRE